MDDDGGIDGIKKVGENWKTLRKPTHTVFVHQKAHMAWGGIEPTILRTSNERSTNWATAARLHFKFRHYL